MPIIKLQTLMKKDTPQVRDFIIQQLKHYGYGIHTGQWYVFAQGTAPVCLVAHIDTVHAKPPSKVYYDPTYKVMWSPDGLGADDRAGVWAILKILDLGYRPSVLFTDLEESGGMGAQEAGRQIKPDGIKYMVEIDRRGAHDAVFYSEDGKEFKDYIQAFGFKPAVGSFSDISFLMSDWGVAGVNVSAGYYNEHSTSEHLFVNELLGSVDRVIQMIEASHDAPVFKHTEARIPYKYIGWPHLFGYEDGYIQCYLCSEWLSPEEQYVWEDEYGEEWLLCPKCARMINEHAPKGTEAVKAQWSSLTFRNWY